MIALASPLGTESDEDIFQRYSDRQRYSHVIRILQRALCGRGERLSGIVSCG